MKLLCQRGQPHEYVDLETGTKLFSVSQVRRVMWDGFSKVPPDVLEAARIRGRRLHARFAKAMFAQVGLCPYPEIIPDYAGWSISMDDWFSKVKPKPVLIERPSANLTLGIAGTADALMLYSPKELVTICDLKTGEPTPTDGVQIDAYQTMDDYKHAVKRLDLYLDKYGGEAREEWRVPNPVDWACFLNALQRLKCDDNIRRWREGK